jgi:hypothetical protein
LYVSGSEESQIIQQIQLDISNIGGLTQFRIDTIAYRTVAFDPAHPQPPALVELTGGPWWGGIETIISNAPCPAVESTADLIGSYRYGGAGVTGGELLESITGATIRVHTVP